MAEEFFDLRKYNPEPTARRFHGCDDFVRGILGPVGCFPPETEFLSPRGWVPIGRYAGEMVAQYEEGRVTFVTPEKYVVLPCDSFIEFKNKHSLHLVMSDEHRLPLSDFLGRRVVRTAAELEANPSNYTLVTTFESGLQGIEDFKREPLLLRLAVAINADGHFPNRTPKSWCVFSLRKERKKERLKWLLGALGIEYSERTYEQRPTETVFTFVSPVCGKHYRGGWWQSSAEELEVIFEEFQHWDGLFEGEDCRFSTTDKQDADFIQYVAHAVGGRATISVDEYPEHPNWKPGFTVHIARPGSLKASVHLRKDACTIQRVPAVTGKKYCFTMPSGYFLARHGGRVFVSANSGKSVACCWEAFTRALEMPPGKDGIRRSRWAFIRNSYPELIATTMSTWKDWVPEKLPNGEPFCTIRRTAPIVATIDRAELPDGTRLLLEVHFLALDKEEDVRKLKSLELTGVFMNEASELSEEVLKMATTRVGRFPAKVDFGEFDENGKPQFEYDKDGVVTKCPFWTGLIMDTNPPDDMHWWYRLAEKEKPKNYRFFRQPPAMLPVETEIEQNGSIEKITDWVPNQGQDPNYPAAENMRNHPFGWGYYKNLVTGKDVEWCKVYVMGEYGTLVSGRPVYPEFRHSLHVARDILLPMRGIPVVVGLDYGLNHSAALLQVRPTGQVVLLDEIVTENCGSRRFASEYLRPLITSEKYSGCQFVYTGDPAGSQRSTTDEATCISILRECGFYVDQAITNNFAARRDAVAKFLTMLVEGRPGMLISPTCVMLIKGFISGYNYRKMALGGAENRYTSAPDKNIFSHPHDAVQYACLKIVGGGAGIEEDPFSGSRRMSQAGSLGRKSARPVKKSSAMGWT